MAKSKSIELPSGDEIAILYEDRAILAIDKPAGWMLAPNTWTRTRRNLQLELENGIKAGDFWAKSRNLRYLRYAHRLDAETSGVVLFAKSPGALTALSELFESREVQKTYLAVVEGAPKRDKWTCTVKLSAELDENGRIQIDHVQGREAETAFEVVERKPESTLLQIYPLTGRTHQIRVHAAATNHPIVGDPLYNPRAHPEDGLALRAIEVRFPDPFSGRPIRVRAESETFLRAHRFAPTVAVPENS